jgi:hypothetical protein
MEQLIQILADGTVTGLQVSEAKGIDLTTLGDAKVVRSSEIVWHEAKQCWLVKLLHLKDTRPWYVRWFVPDGRWIHSFLNVERWFDVFEETVCRHPGDTKCPWGIQHFPHFVFLYAMSMGRDSPIYGFKTYEDAITAEVAYIQGKRERDGAQAV